jgi:hypothetical protein
MKILNIGTQMFAVHKRYVDQKLKNGTIIVCKIKSYMNYEGEIIPLLREVGGTIKPHPDTHYLFTDLKKAIKAITT